MPVLRNAILFSMLLFAKFCTSQTIKPGFNLVEGTKEIRLGKVLSMAQDRYGYMWFVDNTNRCLVRYDGYRMKTYQNDPSDSNSLGAKVFECITADKHGNIWIATVYGADKFDPTTNIFTHYVYKNTDAFRGKSNRMMGINNILVDDLDIVWMGTMEGLYQLDQKTGKFTHYVHNDNDPSSLSYDIVRSLYEDKEGVLWAGAGYAFDPDKKGGLNKFNRATGTFTRYMHDPKNPQSLASNKVRAIFEDSKGNFWVGTDGDGLHIMDRKKGTFERFTHDPLHPEKLSRPPVKKGQLWDHITFITEDMTGAVWIGTYMEGLVRYDPDTKTIMHFNSADKNRLKGFTDNSGWCTYTSREGTLWISTEQSKLFRIDPLQTGFSEVKMGRAIHQFLEDHSGNLLLNSYENGLSILNTKTNVEKRFLHNPADPSSLSANWVAFSQPASNGQFWVGTWNGLNLYNPETNKFTRYFYNPKNDGKDTGAFAVLDLKDERYFGLITGLCIQDKKTGSVNHYNNNPADTNSISAGAAINFLYNKEGNIWISLWYHDGAALELFDVKTKKFKHYLKGLLIRDIFKQSDGSIWVGTDKGLYYRNDSLDSFSPAVGEGIPFRNALIQSITEDADKNLWGSSSVGIFRLNPSKKELGIYGNKFGVDPNIMSGAVYKTGNGELLFGNQYGYYKCSPHSVINYYSPKVILTDFKIDGRPVIPFKNSSFNDIIENTKEINLQHDQNIFSIDFAAIHFSDPDNNIHQYMLEGYENTWRNAGLEKTAYYFNIPPDRYVFRIKASNSYGINAELAVDVIIHPPWWQTWWFRISAIILSVAILYLTARWWLSRKFKLQLERSEKERQMAELKQKGTELEMQALRAQMNPHFIFNSLNSINRFILQNNKVQASEYLTKFSKLVRMILQNSQASLIPLDSELESLELYLNLEALRFNYHFEYKISVPKDMDISAFQVPPLILQPYVENAIWHGLMHKEDKGKLDVEVSEENDHLYFKITDNGIGREKAAALASKSATKHKSMGLRITAHRIAILQNSETMTSPVTINDLADADGNAAGTEVTIKMPVKYD